MCAVIGAYIENPSSQDLIGLAKVFYESSIRGLHATGISWVKGGKIHSHIDGVPAAQFLESLDLRNAINEDGNLYLIGHCRYSTSDFRYNQPLWDDDLSIVHNGVVSQEMPENWERLFGYKCKTQNDSELIIHTLKANKSPLIEFADASMAVVELYKEKKMRFYRNGKRPIYFTCSPNSVIITSTADIALRANIGVASEAPMDTYITISSGLKMQMDTVQTNHKDLQHV